MPLILEISSYLIIALILGYLFGWLITKARLKETFLKKEQELHLNIENQDEIETINAELIQYKQSKSELLASNNKIQLQNSENKLHIHNLNQKLSAKKEESNSYKKLLLEKNSEILEMKKNYETEMSAFMDERIDLIEKYKKLQALQENKKESEDSWIDNIIHPTKN